MPLTKVKSKKPKNHEKMHKNENTQNSPSFLVLAFFRGICLSWHQRIWNQHKIQHFFIPILIFFKKKFFWVIAALFAYFKCKCEKTVHFQTIRKNKKVIFLPISIILCLIPIKFETLKPPYGHPHFFLVEQLKKALLAQLPQQVMWILQRNTNQPNHWRRYLLSVLLVNYFMRPVPG